MHPLRTLSAFVRAKNLCMFGGERIKQIKGMISGDAANESSTMLTVPATLFQRLISLISPSPHEHFSSGENLAFFLFLFFSLLSAAPASMITSFVVTFDSNHTGDFTVF